MRDAVSELKEEATEESEETAESIFENIKDARETNEQDRDDDFAEAKEYFSNGKILQGPADEVEALSEFGIITGPVNGAIHSIIDKES